MVQWLGIHPAMQGIMVQSLVWEKVHRLQSSYAPAPQLPRPHLEPVLPSKRSHCNEKPEYHSEEEPLAHCNLRKPEHSNKDSAWPKIK